MVSGSAANETPVRGSVSGRWGACRLFACGMNAGMILGIYAEYLWAADWLELPKQCNFRSELPWLELADCFHRYTFSHAMLRGQNLSIFAYIGSIVVACLIMAEKQRKVRLTKLLQARLHGDPTPSTAQVAVHRSLNFLSIYSSLLCVALPGVLLLVPFNLSWPRMHYGCTVLALSSFVVGMILYATMPLGAAAGEDDNELSRWAERHARLRFKVWCIVALHLGLPAAAGLHHLLWLDVTGRLFGFCEVMAILSYQFFLASFSADDFAADPDRGRSIVSKALPQTSPAPGDLANVFGHSQ
ncbi:unnamed protein product [Symbiodinium pilosum]|uniref:Uncharacterized protein n=1 Tax=Symbiodinium pilosum TaxID=2952 RepID=A0A812MLU1_SYMPI|nr:unnamed protein product [Symbiodinium pilosum]